MPPAPKPKVAPPPPPPPPPPSRATVNYSLYLTNYEIRFWLQFHFSMKWIIKSINTRKWIFFLSFSISQNLLWNNIFHRLYQKLFHHHRHPHHLQPITLNRRLHLMNKMVIHTNNLQLNFFNNYFHFQTWENIETFKERDSC